jgi:aminopeptidase N
MTLLLYSPACTQNSPNASIDKFDVQRYSIFLYPDIQNKTFSGNLSLTAKVLLNSDKILLNASTKTLIIDSILQIQNNQSNNITLFHHHNDILEIPITNYAGEEINIHIYYRGLSDFNGEFNNGGIFFAERNNRTYIASCSEPTFANKWFPCKDVPSDKATAQISIQVPDSFTVASNGLLTNVTNNPNDTKTFVWQTSYPTPNYSISFAAGVYKTIEDTYLTLDGKEVQLKYFVYPEYFSEVQKIFGNTKKMLSFMEKFFGPYPFSKEKYGIVMVPGDLTMENQTITSFQDSLIFSDEAEATLIHELSHHWWGNSLTPLNWHHTWLNEGFATYTTALYYGYYLGKKYYHNFINQYMSPPQGSYAGSVVGQSDTAFWDSFSDRVYYKGAIVLHMLRKIVGDSSFFKILKNYATNPNYTYSNVTTTDFIRECEKVYGQKLDWFFNQWVYANIDSIDRPNISFSWKSKKTKKGYNISATIQQLSSNLFVFKLPIDITINSKTDTKNISVVSEQPIQTFHFKSKTRPLNIELDKDNWVFKELIRDDKK